MRLKAAVFMLLLWAAHIQAIQVTELYQVDEPLQGTEQVQREELLGRAFDSLIWRLTGLKSLASYPQLEELRADPQEIIRGYSNRNTVLRVRFEPASLLERLQQLELAVWGEQRPVLLLWWTQKDVHGQHLYNEDQRMAQLIMQRAAYRGLPVRFPLADLQEQILTESLSLQNQPQIDALLQRYSADLLLRISVDDASQPGASWQLYDHGRISKGSFRASDVAELADGIFLNIGQQLIKKYAVLHGQGEALHIQVAGLDFSRLLRVEEMLQPFSAKLIRLDGTNAVWQVQAMPEQLRALFELQQIQQVPAEQVLAMQELQMQSQEQPEEQQPELLAEQQVDSQPLDAEPEEEPVLAEQEPAAVHIDLYFQ